ncbi:MAG: hypothetical protein HDQ97_01100 [Lachnospiraceae bacterium]|nr:hypothetical protein [Lachnospiraceae bacterium]
MFVIHIVAFIILVLCIAWKFKIQFVESVPVGCALLVLMLYVLSFFRMLSFSDYIVAAGLVAVGIYMFRLGKEKRKEVVDFARQELLRPATLTALAMTVIVAAFVSGKAVSWWDDYNFWATDVKSLFYLDGFAPKYANVAAEFGDYPPGTQMMKWWFLHFSPSEFKEGLLFAGYYFMNLAFLFPLLKVLRKRNIFLMAAGAATIWLFPAVAEVFWCDGCCADLTMAVVYGAFLTAVIDREKHDRFFYYGRQALFLMVLVLCKNTGFIWVTFGLLFDYGYHWMMHVDKKTERQEKKADRYALLAVALLPVLTELSWLLFCLLHRRVAKLTGTAIQMATGGMNIPAYQEQMVRAFAEAFIKWPLHRWKTIGIDLSPLALYLLLLLFIFLLYRFHVMDKKTACYTGSFFALSGVIFYAFNLLSHLTIFAVETQYLEPFGMVSSIERYGAPFTIGGLYLIAFFAVKGRKPVMGAVICMAFVLLTTDHTSAYRALVGYRDAVDEVMAERKEIVDEEAERFLEITAAKETGSIGRVLYLRDISDISWVRNTYVGFEAAPVSVIYGNVDVAVLGSQDIVNAVQDAHAGFLYVNELAGNGEALFAPFMGEEKFEYGCLYQVTEEAGEMRLVKF